MFSIHQQLYEAGCNVLICDLALHREAEAWLGTLDTSPDASHKVVFNKTDVTDWKQLKQAFDLYAKELGDVPYVLCPVQGYETVRQTYPHVILG